MLARYMICATGTSMKPYELINSIAGGGTNQQTITIDGFKLYIIDN
jgi:hypothetical protein